MSEIKSILEEIAADGGKNYKRDTLSKYKDNDLLKQVIYLAQSPRVNFYIKQIPEYTPNTNGNDMPLENALSPLRLISERKVTGSDAKEADGGCSFPG